MVLTIDIDNSTTNVGLFDQKGRLVGLQGAHSGTQQLTAQLGGIIHADAYTAL